MTNALPRRTIFALLSVLAATGSSVTQAQVSRDTTRHATVSGTVSVTNKGISIIPTFTLGKPAAVVELNIRRDRFAFEPQFREGLDGKPWSFVFWGRYTVVRDPRFHFVVGAHPAVLFRRTQTTIGGRTGEYLVARRYLAMDLSPSVTLNKHVNVGVYQLSSRALERDVARNTHFTAARATLSGLPIAPHVHLRLDPQLYVLHIDKQHGTYVNGTATLGRDHLPFSVSVSGNRPLESNVTGGTEGLWNVSLNYAFH